MSNAAELLRDGNHDGSAEGSVDVGIPRFQRHDPLDLPGTVAADSEASEVDMVDSEAAAAGLEVGISIVVPLVVGSSDTGVLASKVATHHPMHRPVRPVETLGMRLPVPVGMTAAHHVGVTMTVDTVIV